MQRRVSGGRGEIIFENEGFRSEREIYIPRMVLLLVMYKTIFFKKNKEKKKNYKQSPGFPSRVE